jgi:hypothetical protein
VSNSPNLQTVFKCLLKICPDVIKVFNTCRPNSPGYEAGIKIPTSVMSSGEKLLACMQYKMNRF